MLDPPVGRVNRLIHETRRWWAERWISRGAAPRDGGPSARPRGSAEWAPEGPADDVDDLVDVARPRRRARRRSGRSPGRGPRGPAPRGSRRPPAGRSSAGGCRRSTPPARSSARSPGPGPRSARASEGAGPCPSCSCGGSRSAAAGRGRGRTSVGMGGDGSCVGWIAAAGDGSATADPGGIRRRRSGHGRSVDRAVHSPRMDPLDQVPAGPDGLACAVCEGCVPAGVDPAPGLSRRARVSAGRLRCLPQHDARVRPRGRGRRGRRAARADWAAKRAGAERDPSAPTTCLDMHGLPSRLARRRRLPAEPAISRGRVDGDRSGVPGTRARWGPAAGGRPRPPPRRRTPPRRRPPPTLRHPQAATPASRGFAHASEAELARILDFYAGPLGVRADTFPILWNLDGDVVESFSPDFYLPRPRPVRRADDAQAEPRPQEEPQAAPPARAVPGHPDQALLRPRLPGADAQVRPARAGRRAERHARPGRPRARSRLRRPMLAEPAAATRDRVWTRTRRPAGGPDACRDRGSRVARPSAVPPTRRPTAAEARRRRRAGAAIEAEADERPAMRQRRRPPAPTSARSS